MQPYCSARLRSLLDDYQDLGMDRMLGATRPRQLSLFRQGLMLFELIPQMREDRLRALAKQFGALLQEHVLLTDILGVI